MDALSDPHAVKNQYRDGANLSARTRLHERFSTNRHGWHRWVFEQLRCPPHARILELGCGTGLLWIMNQERIPANWVIALSDLSPGMLREIRTPMRRLPRRVHLGVADAQSIPFRDSTFEVVLANHMLYHLPDRERALAEIHRVLRRGGIFYAATNGRVDGPTIGDWVRKVRPGLPVGGASAGLHGDFSLESGASQLAPFFTTVDLRRYPDSLEVTEVEALVDYVQSTSAMRLDDRELAEFRRIVGEEIARRGAVRLAKSAGIFVARR